METEKASPRSTGQRLSVEVLDRSEDFAALEEEWDELHRDSPRATPFQSWAWLYSWWETYGEGYEPRLVTVREGDLLVGLIPLMLERRPGLGRLLFVGSGSTDYLDMLAREDREDAVAEAGAAALSRIDSWRVADLQELRPEAAAWALGRHWRGPETRSRQSNCPVTDLRPWEEIVGDFSKNNRKTARRSVRRVEEDGLSRVLAGAQDAEQAAKRLVSLHRESWQGRGIGLEHTTRRFEALQEAAAERMTARGLGGVSEFRRDDGEAVVSTFMVFGRDFVGTYLNGATQQALKRYQFSTLSVWDGMNLASDMGLSYLSHLRGKEPYKLRWASRVVPNHRLILGRNGKVLATYAGYLALRARVGAYLEEYARSDSAPRWVKDAPRRAREVVIRYRTRRSEVARRIEDAAKRLARRSTS